MTPEQSAALRAPFPPEQIGKLPRVTKKDGPKTRCAECGGYLPPHVHLDFVGHAAVTDRLLAVDPEWTWEPVAWADDGGPLIRQSSYEAKLWIRLTVAGTTRLGVGTVPANTFEADKQLIGDAIRNAAMRFGVALDLWSREDLAGGQQAEQHADPPPALLPIVARLNALPDRHRRRVKLAFAERFGPPDSLHTDDIEHANAWLDNELGTLG